MKLQAFFLTTLSIFVSTAFSMDEKGWASTFESLAAFDSKSTHLGSLGNRPGYVKPIISYLGNILNSNWYVSANVPQSLTFEFGLPISLIGTTDEQTFTETDANGNKTKVPTIFGDHCDVNTLGNSCYTSGVVYGNETLNGLSVFTYPYFQAAASFYHARVVLRGMWIPSISELRKFNEFGIGFQYSFGHFFQYMWPAPLQSFDFSFVFGYNTSGIGYRPDEYKGQLDLDISTLNFSLVLGYKLFNFVEFMMSLGYQSAEMKSSGNLTCNTTENGSPTGYYGQTISPNITVKGNNGFRFGLSVAFQLGKSYHPVAGFDYAGKSSFTTNVLYFKYQLGTDKTPSEIAKDKGYDPTQKSSASNLEQDSNTEPLENSAETNSSNPLEQHQQENFNEPSDSYEQDEDLNEE